MREIEGMMSEYREIEARIEILKAELAGLDETGISAINYSANRVQTGNISKTVENIAIKRVDIEKEIRVAQTKLNMMQRALEALPEIERNVLMLKVIEKEPWFILSGKLHMSEQHLRRKKQEALESISKIMFGKCSENVRFMFGHSL